MHFGTDAPEALSHLVLEPVKPAIDLVKAAVDLVELLERGRLSRCSANVRSVGPSQLGHCKVCDLADFQDPELRELIRDVYRWDLEYFGPDFPTRKEFRKHWEVSMTLRAFRHLGALREDAQVLGVGAGHEATLYWLTEKVGKVVATDRYETEDLWSATGDAGSNMLTDPGRYWDGSWNPERLEVRHMNGLDLQFEDESFDAIFSSSSIEHFGGWKDVRRSIEEMFRVLRPGGVAALATEFRIGGDTMGMPGALMFNEAEARALMMDGLWWDPATPFDTAISDETIASAVPFQEAIADGRKQVRYWSRYPHVVLRDGQLVWTSMHVALVKSNSTAAEWRRSSPKRPARPGQVRMPKPTMRERAGKWAYPLVARWRARRGDADEQEDGS
jgi:SAM-dependent methyltransferase